jgi:hypothetical protein
VALFLMRGRRRSNHDSPISAPDDEPRSKSRHKRWLSLSAAAAWRRPGRSKQAANSSRDQVIKQPRSYEQVLGLESFCEPGVDGRQQINGLADAALSLQQPGGAHRTT